VELKGERALASQRKIMVMKIESYPFFRKEKKEAR
jgi:hypothetical protein